jgi:hypothetical protein
MVLVARDVRDPWPGHVQRDTTSDGMLAFGHSRSGLTFIAPVAQQAEQPPCKRQAARSNRRRGHQTCRVRLDGRGHRAFNPGTRVRIPHATPAQEALVDLTLRGRKPAATIGRRRNSSPDGSHGGCSSTLGRAAALQAAGCRFNPCHFHQCNNASLTQWPECRPV